MVAGHKHFYLGAHLVSYHVHCTTVGYTLCIVGICDTVLNVITNINL